MCHCLILYVYTRIWYKTLEGLRVLSHGLFDFLVNRGIDTR